MRMTNKKKILGAVAIAGIVAASGSAFTGGGLSTSGQAGASQFVGGNVTQAVTGAVLQSTAYTVDSGNLVSQIDLSFDSAAIGKNVVATLGTVTYACTSPVAATAPASGSTSACTASPGALNTSDTLTVTVTQP